MIILSLFFLKKEIMGKSNKRKANKRQLREIGRRKKTLRLPFEIIRDCLRLVSMMGPNTKARTRGAPSYLHFFITYPNHPKITMITMSATLDLRL
jgi:hypothetical protein